MTVFNGERHLRSAIDSLLAQTYKDFTLIIIDDCSIDSSPEIIDKFKRADSRIQIITHVYRMGAIASWKQALDYASDQEATYFAWASDHDLWDRKWLEKLLEAIERNYQIALAYPRTIRIDDAGCKIAVKSPDFETSGLTVAGRLRKLLWGGHGYGDMIYGLFRMDALRKTGGYRRVLLPDTATIWELSLVGTIVQIQEDLWFRRYVDLFSIKRQKRTLFVVLPWYVHLPYWLVNPFFIELPKTTDSDNKLNTTNNLVLRLAISTLYGLSFFLIEIRKVIGLVFVKFQKGKCL